MTPSISVIMPVYNAGERLEAAVASVCTQAGVSLELLLVDDGSTDGSTERCRALARRHANVQVLHQENRGICAARNAGLAAAQGNYLAFCDDDDTYLPGFLTRAFALAERTGADEVRMEYRLFRQTGERPPRELPHAQSAACTAARGQGGKVYSAFLRAAGPLFVWNALYRRDALQGLEFSERIQHGLEDFAFTAEFHARCEKLVYDPQPAYSHLERGSGSTSQDYSEMALLGRFAALSPWMEAEYHAASHWCSAKELPAVWNERKTQAITFMMHQLRNSEASPAFQKEAWYKLRTILDGIRRPGPVDFLSIAGQNRKQMAALLLYTLHLTGCYNLLHKKEETE